MPIVEEAPLLRMAAALPSAFCMALSTLARFRTVRRTPPFTGLAPLSMTPSALDVPTTGCGPTGSVQSCRHSVTEGVRWISTATFVVQPHIGLHCVYLPLTSFRPHV